MADLVDLFSPASFLAVHSHTLFGMDLGLVQMAACTYGGGSFSIASTRVYALASFFLARSLILTFILEAQEALGVTSSFSSFLSWQACNGR